MPGFKGNLDAMLNYCNKTIKCAFRTKCDPYKMNIAENIVTHMAYDNAGVEIDDEAALSNNDIIFIHKKMMAEYIIDNNRGSAVFHGTNLIWNKYCGEHFEVKFKYYNSLLCNDFSMSMHDCAVIGYLLRNKFFTSYLQIITISFLVDGRLKDSIENNYKEFIPYFERHLLKVEEKFGKIRLKLAESKLNLTKGDLDKEKEQEEMMKWVNQFK